MSYAPSVGAAIVSQIVVVCLIERMRSDNNQGDLA
jgi:hypothetical protein